MKKLTVALVKKALSDAQIDCGTFRIMQLGKSVEISERDMYYEKWMFRMEQLPGCCGVAVHFNTWVTYFLRSFGLGQKINRWSIETARKLGYGYIMATVTDDNAVQKHIMQKHGWKAVDSFVNPRTGNTVLIYGRNLNDREDLNTLYPIPLK